METVKKILHIHSKKAMIAISILAAVAIILIIGITAIALLLSSDKIYSGISVGELKVSGMTTEQAAKAVNEHYTGAVQNSIRLQYDTYEKELSLSELAAQIDSEKTVELAFRIGRNGHILDRLKEIFSLYSNPVVLPPAITCDDALLEAALGEIAGMFDQPGQDMQLSIGDSELTITRGIAGNCINIPAAMTRFKETILSAEDGVFTLALEEILPTEPNAEAIYTEICGDPVDASYVIENQQLEVIDEKPGVQFDKAEAQRIIDQTLGDVITIPITKTPAQVTADQVRSQLFTDLLGSYSTRYNAGDTARSHNVSLASQKINQVVLGPGDVFSYNTTVGPRTAARGFKTANVYVGNRVEPGIGGGICQVSSTLFNAVVLSDLKIVYRTNHSLPVSYVPLGRDATVSYGSIDFKFSNNTNHPIKIVASASGGNNSISIYGVKDNPAKSIELATEHISTTPAQLVQKEDATLPAGTVKVEQAGSNGSTYHTYKITKENGSVVKRELLTKSTYVPSDRIELIGTMPVEEVPPAPDAPTAAEVPADAASGGNAPAESAAPVSVPVSAPNAAIESAAPPASATPQPTPAAE